MARTKRKPPRHMRVGVLDLATIATNPLNVRIHVAADEVNNAIERYQTLGLPPHVVVDENNLVLSGYAGVKAAIKLNLDRVIISQSIPPFSDAEKRAYLIEDGHSLIAGMIGKKSARRIDGTAH